MNHLFRTISMRILALILLSAFLHACSEKVAPVTTSEIGLDAYNAKCRTKDSDCKGKAIIWPAYFKSRKGEVLTLHNDLGDLTVETASAVEDIARGARITVKGYLGRRSSEATAPIRVTGAIVEVLEDEAQTAERLRRITELQVNLCKQYEASSVEHRGAAARGIGYVYYDLKVDREPWAPEKTRIDYAVRISSASAPGITVAQLLTCEFSGRSVAVSMFTPAQNDIYGRPAIPESNEDIGRFSTPPNYLTEKTATTPVSAAAVGEASAGASASSLSASTTSEPASDVKATAAKLRIANEARVTELVLRAIDSIRESRDETKNILSQVPPPEFEGGAFETKQARALVEQGDHAMSAGDFDQALQLFKQAQLADFSSADAARNIGLALLKQNRSQEAAKAFIDALVRQPHDVIAYIGLGSAWAASGLEDKAVASFSVAYHISSNSKQTLELIRQIAATQTRAGTAASRFTAAFDVAGSL